MSDLIEKKAVEVEDEAEHTYKVKFTLGGKKLQTLVSVGEIPKGPHRAIIGRRDLTGFLIDPTKKPEKKPVANPSVKADVRVVDKTLANLDKELLLIKALKPVNLIEERSRLLQDKRYNPIFSYPEVKIDLDEADKKLSDPLKDDSPLGILLEKKRQELLGRIALIRARGDSAKFTQASRALYGAPTGILLQAAESFIKSRVACDLPPPNKDLLSAEKAQPFFEEVLKQYGLHDWQVTVRKRLVSDCTVGGKKIYLRADAQFSREHINSLIAHEIETHVLTAENGDHQPFQIFRRGCANYLETQEGLAVYNQNEVLSPYSERRYNPPRNVLAVEFGLEHSFADTRKYLEEELGYAPEKAMNQAINIKRGLNDTSEIGGFTKSIVYFRGLRSIEQFVSDGGDLKKLYVGKIALEDLELVEQVPDLQQPVLIPSFLREET